MLGTETGANSLVLAIYQLIFVFESLYFDFLMSALKSIHRHEALLQFSSDEFNLTLYNISNMAFFTRVYSCAFL